MPNNINNGNPVRLGPLGKERLRAQEGRERVPLALTCAIPFMNNLPVMRLKYHSTLNTRECLLTSSAAAAAAHQRPWLTQVNVGALVCATAF